MADGESNDKEATASGTFSEGCIWALGNDGTLTISAADGKSGTMSEVRPEMPGSLADKAERIVVAKGVKAPQDATCLFAGMDAAASIDAANLDISGTETMDKMFSGCASLVDISSLSSWDVSQVQKMVAMFEGCKSLKDLAPLSSWDVSQVWTMGGMFDSCSSLTDLAPLSTWDIFQLRIMDGMFLKCTSLTDVSPLSSWDISQVTGMFFLFEGCTGLADATSPWQEWIDATTSGACGDDCVWELDDKGTLTISPADGESGTLSWLPAHLSHRAKRIVIAKGVKTPQKSMRLFARMEALSSIDAANLDVSGTTKMFGTFLGCTSLTDISSLSSWDVSHVQNMAFMFDECTSLSDISPLSSWNVSELAEMNYLFHGCTHLADATPLEAWKVQQDASMRGMLPAECAAPTWLKRDSNTEQ